jgi:hypothetical protein
MVRISRLFGPVALLWPLWLGAQTQPELTQILARLDKLERDNQALSEEVRSLRGRLDSTGDSKTPPDADGETVPGAGTANPAAGTANPPAGTPATIEQKLDIQGKRIDEQAQTKVEASQKFPIRLTGMALFNAFMNSKQNGGVEYPFVAAAPGAGLDGATLRQTIVGLDFRGPGTVWGGNVHGSVYMDFSAGATNSAMRLRTGSIEIDWKSRNVMVGIEKPIFNPREPSSLAQLAVSPLTGSGNLWLWLPQVRVEQDFSMTRSTGLRAQMGVVQTHEVGPYTGGTFTGTVEPARPALEGRFEFYHNLDDERRLEIAPGFHTSQTHVNGTSVASSLFSLDWFFNPWRRFELTGAFYTGQNVTPLGAGYQQGYGVYYGGVEPVHSLGGWAQVTLHLAPRLDFHLFSGQQDDRNRDLNAGRIGKNLLFGGNLYYHLASNVILGLETTQLRTLYLGQGIRINNHYDVALGYLF